MAYILEKSFPVEAGAYTTAGEASTTIKRTLKQLGISAEVLRHVSVACYEVELNLVIHSLGGTLTLLVDPEKVTLISKDVGPGIPDIAKASSVFRWTPKVTFADGIRELIHDIQERESYYEENQHPYTLL